MTTFKLVLEYDGTQYAGWQRQPNAPTIQAAVEEALAAIAQTRLTIIGAGRTDAGVHAFGQVASFRTDRGLSQREWLRALNAHLPADISALSVKAVPDHFHARYSANGKLYEYHLMNRSERAPLLRERAWMLYKPLDFAAMTEAAAYLTGSHDFSSFETAPTDNENPQCRLQRADLRRQGDLIILSFYADRFLKQMVRSMVGTLVEVGQGKRTAADMRTVLAARARAAAGRTAPAHGLYLVRVDYTDGSIPSLP
ncbi:tRNA pseudouridine synthase A [Nitrospira defluvii]|jgi:tRNA pseudouridine38-40 synthase|uniref:tRNA pseudouridine synthase A n=1 Tax=Nitrospira defluvii TaxID=330214 RepID=D8PHD2_9BACT|nr:tRNA pseudouridine synthase A [Nitrospira defluvii]